jgi:hypothetical protein
MSDTRFTLSDLAKSEDPNGSQAQVIELMNQYNPPIQDAPSLPSNDELGHQVTYRRSLPAVGTAKINKGITRSKSATDQRRDVIGYFAGRSEVDRRIRKLKGDASYFAKRASEMRAMQEGLAQLGCNTLFYGDIAADESSYNGLSKRLSTLNQGTSRTTSQVWSMGAVVGGDACSIFVVDWGQDAAHLIHPPTVVAGIDTEDLLNQPVDDNDGASFQADVFECNWYHGLAVENPTHVGRLANIDASDAKLDAPTQGKLIDTLDEIFAYMPNPGPNQRVLYCPIPVWAAFNKQARDKANVVLTVREYLGTPTPFIHEWPLRRVDQLSTTETVVA